MKFLKFLAMALVITLSLTFTSIAANPVSTEIAASVSFSKAEKVTVAAATIITDRTVIEESYGVSFTDQKFSAAAFTSSGDRTNSIPNVSSQNRNVYLNDVNAESPPDANLENKNTAKSLGEMVKQMPGFDKTAFVRRQ